MYRQIKNRPPDRSPLDLSAAAQYQHQIDLWERGLEEWADEFRLCLERGEAFNEIPLCIS